MKISIIGQSIIRLESVLIVLTHILYLFRDLRLRLWPAVNGKTARCSNLNSVL